jgi:hypothetical protein
VTDSARSYTIAGIKVIVDNRVPPDAMVAGDAANPLTADAVLAILQHLTPEQLQKLSALGDDLDEFVSLLDFDRSAMAYDVERRWRLIKAVLKQRTRDMQGRGECWFGTDDLQIERMLKTGMIRRRLWVLKIRSTDLAHPRFEGQVDDTAMMMLTIARTLALR